MMCPHCEARVRDALLAVPGVADATADFTRGTAAITLSAPVPDSALADALSAAGYPLLAIPPRPRVPLAAFLASLAAVVALGWLLTRAFGVNLLAWLPGVDGAATLGALFAAGLLTGLHCAGMCGALLLGAATARPGKSPRPWLPALAYNLARTAAYAAVGAAAGALGAALPATPAFRGTVQIAAAVTMLALALRMLGLVTFRLPRFLRPRAPAVTPPDRLGAVPRAVLLGLATALMPCGPLQAMQLWALGSGSALRGALGMLLFGLGTAPLLFAFGTAVNLLARRRAALTALAAALMVALSAGMLVRGLRAWGLATSPAFAALDCCTVPEAPAEAEPEAPAESAPAPVTPPSAPYILLRPDSTGTVAVPHDLLTPRALYIDVPSGDPSAPTVQLLALRDAAGRPRISLNTCQACSPSPRAWFAQRPDGALVCQTCGNVFPPESVGAPSRGCSPAAIPGLRETPTAFHVPASALDPFRPAFRAWSGPRAPEP
jgi:sulfite exporter TauE/SafE/copper chaperone CopZ